jgi:hypothetical protein
VALLLLQVQLLDEKSLRKMLNALDKRVSGSSSSSRGTTQGTANVLIDSSGILLKQQQLCGLPVLPHCNSSSWRRAAASVALAQCVGATCRVEHPMLAVTRMCPEP